MSTDRLGAFDPTDYGFVVKPNASCTWTSPHSRGGEGRWIMFRFVQKYGPDYCECKDTGSGFCFVGRWPESAAEGAVLMKLLGHIRTKEAPHD